MASLTRCLARAIPSLSSLASRSAPSLSLSTATFSTFSLQRLRPLSAAAVSVLHRLPHSFSARSFSTRQSSSSLHDPNPNWSNRPPKETILLDGCDFEHWLIVMEKPEGEPTRDEIIDSYIKTLAMVVGSEEEARMKIYSVSTRCYYAFGALVSEDVSLKMKELPRVRWVLPDSYLDVRNKDYGGEPFIDGKAVPYDPKYHEEWIRNNARASERNRRNDRPRNADRSRNFERRRENMQNRDFQSRDMPPMQNSQPNTGGGPPPSMGGGPPPSMGGGPPPSMGGGPPPIMGGGPPPSMGGGSPPSMGGGPPPSMGGRPPPSMSGAPPQHNYGGPQNYQGGQPNNYAGGMPPQSNYGGGGMPPQSNYGGGGGGMPPSNYGGGGGGMPPSNYGGGGGSNYGGGPSSAQPQYGGGGAPNNYGGGGMPQNSFGGGNSSQQWQDPGMDPRRNGQ